MKILIIEDEIWAQKILESLISKHLPKSDITCTSNIDESIKAISQIEPDLIFMDIKLGSENSFEIINHFNDQQLNIIFVTSYQEFAFNAFKVNAIDYILKPVNEADIVAAINKFQKNEIQTKNNDKSKDKLLVYKTDRLYPIEISKIVKLKSENQYTSIYTIDNQKVISSKPLSHFETELDDTKFVRVHHSYIVNLDYIKNIKTGLNPSILLSNDEIIPISRRKKKELLNKFST